MWLLNIICHFKSQDFTCISATDIANSGRFSMHLEVMVHVVSQSNLPIFSLFPTQFSKKICILPYWFSIKLFYKSKYL
ncbi:50S ribosomal protein L32 [Frankliniella fusca]|uniref:50S ribosomal protein L32 n=1 Tax=Frankliniella fusca TaxID=407009 RepID=A0AAE1GSF6_9NEOP|nr:50S ribosomal protein L32 [Frankliniella fusca]